MDDLLATSAAERRFVLLLFEAFGLVALVLAATGIYGVLAGSVTERMREIGVRVVLGATRGDILALVIRQGMTLTGLGARSRFAWRSAPRAATSEAWCFAGAPRSCCLGLPRASSRRAMSGLRPE